MSRLLTFLIAFSLLFSVNALASGVQIMTKEELQPLIGTKAVVILDVRAGRDWSTSEFKIKGAMRTAAGDFDDWSMKLDKGKKTVLYCA